MIGLLMKDIIALRGFWRIIALMIAVFLVVGYIAGGVDILVSMLMLLCAMMPMNALALDDQCKWNAYACVLPVSRQKTVQARYLLVLLLLAASVVLIGVMGVIIGFKTPMDWTSILISCVLMVSLSLAIDAIMLPLMYKFGVEKSRLILMLVFMAGMMGFTMVMGNVDFSAISSVPLWLGLPASAALYAVSYFLSAKIYQQKEF